jgi:hypothetical protein
MTIKIPKFMYSSDGYGGKYLRQSTRDFYWGEKSEPVTKDWKPKAKIPQLENLIDVFNKTFTAIAGGAVLGSYHAVEYGDIDLFPLEEKAVQQAKDILTNMGYRETSCDDSSCVYERGSSSFRKVQLVLLHTDAKRQVQTLLNRFDISVCQVAVYGGKLHTNTVALDDIRLNLIRTRNTLNIGSLWNRINKYYQRGFNIIDMEEPDKKSKKDEKDTDTAVST